jgi:hypothetical protein
MKASEETDRILCEDGGCKARCVSGDVVGGEQVREAPTAGQPPVFIHMTGDLAALSPEEHSEPLADLQDRTRT